MTLAEVAAARPIGIGTASGYLAACLENGKVFPWDRRRLGIDSELEHEVCGKMCSFNIHSIFAA